MTKSEGDRFKELRKKLGLTQAEMGEMLGIVQTYVGQIERGDRGKGLSGSVIKAILAEWPHVNPIWLTQGRGEMFISDPDHAGQAAEPSISYRRTKNYLVPASAQAGHLGEWSQEWMDQNLQPVLIPGVHGQAMTFEVAGDSMHPTFRDGDYAVGRRLRDKSEIRSNHVHVIVTRSAGVYIKRVTVDDGTLIMESDNQEYRTISVPAEDVQQMYYVVMRLTTNLSGPRPADSRINYVERFLARKYEDEFQPFDPDLTNLKTPKQ